MSNMLSRLDAINRPDQIVVRDSRQSLTAGALIERSRQLADELSGRDIRVLALRGDNSVDWIVVDLACQIAAIVLVPLPLFFSDGQIQHILDSIPVDAVLNIETGGRPRLKYSFPSLENQERHFSRGLSPVSVFPEHTGKITFTSGSTGTPKGVCLGNQQLIRQAVALAKAVNVKQPRHLCLLPLSTLLENVAGVYTPLVAGGEVIVPSLAEIGFQGSSALNPAVFTEVISKHAPGSIILTPQMLMVLVAAAGSGWNVPKSLEYVAVGGSRVSPDLLTQAHRLGIPAYEGYGLSECTSVVSLNTAAHNRPGSCGEPLAHLNVTIEEGEIIVSGNAMLGYAGDPDSWNKSRIATGDLGFLDDDGYLFINGRKKNLLISSYGRNINPEWVESELLAGSLLAECVVFGDAQPFCIAVVFPRNPATSDQQIQSWITQVNEKLPDYARIQRWYRLPGPLGAGKNLVTENGRPRREAIWQHYQQEIQALYHSATDRLFCDAC